MSIQFPRVRVAATQISPCFLDIRSSLDKACAVIKEAASNGAELVGFPEAYFCGYPWWIMIGDPFTYGQKYYDICYLNAFEIPGPEMAIIAACARENKIFVCISGTEHDNGTLYLTQVWFDDQGNLLGKHRKVCLTSGERAIWGEGDGSMFPVFKTKIGNLGGLHSWEHRMPANLLIMNAQNEQLHVASWPSCVSSDDHLFSCRTGDNAIQYYAITVGTFVVACTMLCTPDIINTLAEGDLAITDTFAGGGGHSGIWNPRGTRLTEILAPDEEGILYADIDLAQIIDCKYLIDCAGHSSKGSVAQLTFSQDSQNAVIFTGEQNDFSVSFEKLSEYEK